MFSQRELLCILCALQHYIVFLRGITAGVANLQESMLTDVWTTQKTDTNALIVKVKELLA